MSEPQGERTAESVSEEKPNEDESGVVLAQKQLSAPFTKVKNRDLFPKEKDHVR